MLKTILLDIYISYKLCKGLGHINRQSVTTYSQAKEILKKQAGTFQDFLHDFAFDLRDTMFLEQEAPSTCVLQPQQPIVLPAPAPPPQVPGTIITENSIQSQYKHQVPGQKLASFSNKVWRSWANKHKDFV